MSDLSAANFRGEKKNLKIANLRRDARLQGRADTDAVKKYTADVAEAVRAGVEIDEIYVIRIEEPEVDAAGKPVEPGDYVVDGFRRTGGYEAAGRAALPAIVRVGTWKDAVDVATSANFANTALIRTIEDKKRQVLMSFANHPDRSLRWHSEHCRVGNELPQKLWPAFEKTLDPEVVKRIKAEGRVSKKGTRQSATKKKKAKAPSAASPRMADWKGYEAAFNWITRFLDDLAERDGRKTKAEAAERARKTFGNFVLEWKEELQKQADEAAAKAKAALEAEAKKDQAKSA